MDNKSLEEAISMEPVKEKLKNLQQYMPKEEETIYKFGEFLADRLNPELNPMGFYIAVELALYDLQTGINGYTNKPISNSLVGHHPMMYAILKMSTVDIAKAICPKAFGQCVKEIDEKVKNSI